MRELGTKMKLFVIVLSMLFATEVFPLEKDEVDYYDLAARCYISPQGLSKIFHQPETVIIDIRRTENYRLSPINNSVNMKLYQIQTKNYLKKKNMVIVGNAFSEMSLLKACMKLRGDGYNHVHILKDGSAAWFKYGNLPKNNKLYKTIYYLSPGDLRDLYFKNEFFVLNISGEENGVVQKNISDVKVVALSGKQSKLFSKIGKFAEKNRKISKFILIDMDGNKYRTLHKLNMKYADKFFFFLDGGLTALKKYETSYLRAVKKELKVGNVKKCVN